jgi:hypothetical protein
LPRRVPAGWWRYERVLRGIDEGDPAVLDATESPAIGPAARYEPGDLARDLGVEPADRSMPRAVSAYADAFTDAFWQETERAARDHAGWRQARPPPQSRDPAKSSTRQKGEQRGKE